MVDACRAGGGRYEHRILDTNLLCCDPGAKWHDILIVLIRCFFMHQIKRGASCPGAHCPMEYVHRTGFVMGASDKVWVGACSGRHVPGSFFAVLSMHAPFDCHVCCVHLRV